MIANSMLGKSFLKYHQIAISDNITELSKLVDNLSVELIELDREYMIVLNLDIPELRISEKWEVGINHCHNSSEMLEPFDLGIIRVSDREFLIRLSATTDPNLSEDYLYSLDLYAKFTGIVPKDFEGLNGFYDVA